MLTAGKMMKKLSCVLSKGALLWAFLIIQCLCFAQSAPEETRTTWPREPMSSLTKSVLEKWARAYQKVQSLEYVETMTYASSEKNRKPTQVTLRFWGRRPTLARVEVSVSDANEDGVMICDGKIIWEYYKPRNIYMKTPYPDSDLMIQGELGSLAYVVGPSLMFAPKPFLSLVQGATSMSAKMVQRDGQTEALVTRVQGDKIILTWLNTKDYIPRRYKVYQVKEEGMTEILSDTRTSLQINRPIPDETFVFSRPRGARLAVPERPELALLKPGVALPELPLLDEQGKPLLLSSVLGKTSLVVFWAQWLPLSMEMLTDLTHLKEEMERSGVSLQVVGICTWDIGDALLRYRKENPSSPALIYLDANYQRQHTLSVPYRLFGVRGLPTVYLVNAEGKVLRGWVGAGRQSLATISKVVRSLSPE